MPVAATPVSTSNDPGHVVYALDPACAGLDRDMSISVPQYVWTLFTKSTENLAKTTDQLDWHYKCCGCNPD
jgi:hypothetical protein